MVNSRGALIERDELETHAFKGMMPCLRVAQELVPLQFFLNISIKKYVPNIVY